MNILDTYIICHTNLTQKLKQIDQFQIDLGSSLLNNDRFNPKDVRIQSHLNFHSQIINKIGALGSLGIYTNNVINLNTLEICNGDKILQYKIDDNLSIYDNLNTAIVLFKTKNTEQQKTTIQSTKPFSEMTLEERIAFARSK